ncbi:hypothetical protein [Allosphingosinicella sp.]|jgi:hypothetical protein|uniref:hypothetical protein n=1 Tax=Allosphingosinicella sp. TaxID=2823234 RepID=UPI002EF943D9
MDAKKIALPVAVWIGVGTALGIAMGNLALWIGLGAAFGLFTGLLLNRRGGS